jgi:hypothetical protein
VLVTGARTCRMLIAVQIQPQRRITCSSMCTARCRAAVCVAPGSTSVTRTPVFGSASASASLSPSTANLVLQGGVLSSCFWLGQCLVHPSLLLVTIWQHSTHASCVRTWKVVDGNWWFCRQL